MNISCIHRNIPKDLTLSAEERRHPPLPHLVVLPITEDLNLVLGTSSLDLRLVRVNEDPNWL
jgi:hypothetical protein